MSGSRSPVRPGCQEAGLQSDANEVGRIAAQGCGERLRITRPLSALDRAASFVNDMDRGLLIRNVEGSVVRHNTLRRRFGRGHQTSSLPAEHPCRAHPLRVAITACARPRTLDPLIHTRASALVRFTPEGQDRHVHRNPEPPPSPNSPRAGAGRQKSREQPAQTCSTGSTPQQGLAWTCAPFLSCQEQAKYLA